MFEAAQYAGTRREDYTDDPEAPQPVDDLIRETMNTALGTAGASLPFAAKGAAGVFGGRLSQTADLNALDEAQRMLARGENRWKILRDTDWFQGLDQKWRYEIPDDMLSVTQGEGTGFLGRPVHHRKLSEAYPKADIYSKVITPTRKESGLYTENPRELTINAATPERARSFGAHELQHWIQQQEDFARGTHPSDMMFKAIEALDRLGLPRKLPQRTHNNAIEAAQEAYRRHAGEVEARNVQRRLDFTPKQRRNTPPWETEDRLPHEQIVTGMNDPQEFIKLLLQQQGL
jgi:hypothetical protein